MLFLIDLDGFNRVNDALGLSTGDAVLKLVADRLRPLGSVDGVAPSPSDGLVARIAGDEFAVMASPRDPLGTAARIRDLFVVPFDVGGIRLELQASIGAATVEDGHANAAVRRAEIARFSAKKLDDRIAVYCESMEKADPACLGPLADLRLAIERRRSTCTSSPSCARRPAKRSVAKRLLAGTTPLGRDPTRLVHSTGGGERACPRIDLLRAERSIVACRSWKDLGHDLSARYQRLAADVARLGVSETGRRDGPPVRARSRAH